MVDAKVSGKNGHVLQKAVAAERTAQVHHLLAERGETVRLQDLGVDRAEGLSYCQTPGYPLLDHWVGSPVFHLEARAPARIFDRIYNCPWRVSIDCTGAPRK